MNTTSSFPMTPKWLLKSNGFILDKSRLLGQGAYATVFVCHCAKTRAEYAAKVVRFGALKSQQWDTEGEIENLAALQDHRNIVPFITALRSSQFTVLVLGLVPGPSFLDGLLLWPQFNYDNARCVIHQLLRALCHCHQHRVIHRDLAPENIIWHQVPSKENPNVNPQLKLIDFNLSRHIPEEKEHIYPPSKGNPMFMSPESLGDKPRVSLKSDVWAVGIYAYILLGGYPPFWSNNYQHLLENVSEANYSMPNHLWFHVSKSGRDFVRRMLTGNPSHRLSASDLLTENWVNKRSHNKKRLIAHQRMVAFFREIDERKRCADNRKFTLVQEQRQPFQPRFVHHSNMKFYCQNRQPLGREAGKETCSTGDNDKKTVVILMDKRLQSASHDFSNLRI